VSEAPGLIYLEADDEITSVVRRVRTADVPRVVIVAPGRSRATSSAVALRLLARAGEESGREVAIVGDALTRSLAAEAGLPAFATADEARSAEPGTAGEVVEPRHATINVVRGAATDDTIGLPAALASDDLTQAVPVVTPPRTEAPPRRRRSRRTAATGVVAGLAAVLLVGFVAGAAILPAATITIVPRSEPIGPIPYVVEIEDPERLGGTAEASTTVTATETFEILESATGDVVLLNWSSVPQPIAAGTLVAAGEQAFATQADVVVPRGRLTPDGRIEAGQVGVAVVAEAPGPAANVDARSINVVLSQDADARLRLFPENPERRVDNFEPTTGGKDESGPRISQADVDAAVEALRADLRDQVARALAERGDAIVVQSELAEPVVDGADELVGAHDDEEQLSATLEWEAFAVDPAEVIESARRQFEADPGVLPEGHVLLADSIELAVEEANMTGGIMRVDVTATGSSAAEIDTAEVLERAVGRTPDEARAALADLGVATVELWPGWVGTVPATEWRIDVRVAER
jgi:hypothetical protein